MNHVVVKKKKKRSFLSVSWGPPVYQPYDLAALFIADEFHCFPSIILSFRLSLFGFKREFNGQACLEESIG
jgi:hypothetical protein